MTVIDWIVGHGSLFDRTSTPEKGQVVAKLITPTESKVVKRNPQEDYNSNMSQSQLSHERNNAHQSKKGPTCPKLLQLRIKKNLSPCI